MDGMVLPVLCMAGRRRSHKGKWRRNCRTYFHRSSCHPGCWILSKIKEWRSSPERSYFKIQWPCEKLWYGKNRYDAVCRRLGVWGDHKWNRSRWYRTLPSTSRTFRRTDNCNRRRLLCDQCKNRSGKKRCCMGIHQLYDWKRIPLFLLWKPCN